MTEPTTPAGLPRNREADAWRMRAVHAEGMMRMSWAFSWVLFVVFFVVSAKLHGERDAARAQVAAFAAFMGGAP